MAEVFALLPHCVFDGPVRQRCAGIRSGASAIIDVTARDEPGLLNLLCRVIARHAVNIAYASVSCYGDHVRDVFCLSHAGAKVSDNQTERLREALVQALCEETIAGRARTL